MQAKIMLRVMTLHLTLETVIGFARELDLGHISRKLNSPRPTSYLHPVGHHMQVYGKYRISELERHQTFSVPCMRFIFVVLSDLQTIRSHYDQSSTSSRYFSRSKPSLIFARPSTQTQPCRYP
eukprot:1328408-Amorphochlora_amoeboformis.AAC.1